MRFLIIISLTLISFFRVYSKERDTILLITGSKVELKYPSHAVKGTILVLPGWNFSQDDICIKSSFCKVASDKGYILVMPDMQKSIYHSSKFKETRTDWLKYHTIQWITDTLIPLLQHKYSLLKEGLPNYLFGISTGGRGVAVMAMHIGVLFKAGAALSGDYDPTLCVNDNLMKGYLGDYKDFPDRWEGIDNPVRNAEKITIPLYLAHGKDDKIVSPDQTLTFYNHLQKIHSSTEYRLNIVENAGHDYVFWNSQYAAVFDFFQKYN
jgi:S-formylglutathione hydrolase FrmB